MDYPVSDELKARLHRQNVRDKRAATLMSHRMKWANDLLDQTAETIGTDHSPSGGEEFRPKMKPGRLRIVRSRPFLAVIEGGKR